MTMVAGLIALSVVLLNSWTNALSQQAPPSRRAFLAGLSSAVVAAPAIANGIDVTGLPVEGSNNAVIKNQLKAYDGSGTARIEQIKQASPPPTKPRPPPVVAQQQQQQSTPSSSSSIASFALRYGEYTSLTRIGFGDRYRLNDYLVGPTTVSSGKVSVSFEFPSDWLQLDKLAGGLQYVDQRNGDKLYVLRVTLPPSSSLDDTPKSFFGDAIFNAAGPIARDVNIDEYRVSKSVVLVPNARRRLLIKYSTVTGNGLRVERRALVDAQQIAGTDELYMLVTSSNAVKFEAKGRERETVEAIVDSFLCDKL